MSATAIRTISLVSALAMVAARHYSPLFLVGAAVVLIVGAAVEVVRS